MDTISDQQWLVIGLLLMLFVAELVLHPTVYAGLTNFLKAFKPAKAATT